MSRPVSFRQKRLPKGEANGSVAPAPPPVSDTRASALTADFFRSTLEALSEAVVVIDPAGMINYFSVGAQTLFGWRAGDVEGRNFAMLLAAGDRLNFAQRLRRYAKGGDRRSSARSRDLAGLDRDGRPLTLAVRITDFSFGGETFFVAAMRDVSDQRPRQAALVELTRELAERNARVDAAFDTVSEGVCLYDSSGAVVCFNHRYARLLGLPDEAIRAGMAIDEVFGLVVSFGGEGSIDPRRWSAPKGSSRTRQRQTLRYRRRDGKSVEIVDAPLADGRSMTIVRDVTDIADLTAALELARRQAEQASEAKQAFLAHVSHELRTPLNAILGFSEALTMGLLGDLSPKQQDYIGDIHTAGRHLLEIVNHVLDMTKIGAGRMDMEEEHFDLRAALDDTIAAAAIIAGRSNVKLRLPAPIAVPDLLGDRRLMVQALTNLITHAVQATPSGGSVEVVVAPAEDGGVGIAVTDNGIGMSEDESRVALIPFGQMQGPYVRADRDAGLALPLAKLVVELHRGRMEICSAPGEGTSVVIRLPPDRVSWVRGNMAAAGG